ncbi:MAG: type II toxin-antitoxin system RelE/ParE family toxin [Phenylobacterium sp.]|uniref:type II toxin-antitoxin system RelE/ParE family toxin n=1 Tax=Phenylobacterium sp. TaxID=1871053 RepID=UPI002734907E|nr:type II toxin-antitoxin system RelE/ParE family toxin [Phenylobacterium sp.]MDP3746837.1 type II toxin-antitoxin system RelE/ParE family toxin [Phenylobacterium sp.]
MKRQVLVLGCAKRDLARLGEFLSVKSPRAANRAAAAISDAVLSLAELAERGHPDPEGRFREVAVHFGRDGYVIQYLVEPKRVLVARIFHSLEDRAP